MSPRKTPFNGAPPSAFDHDQKDGPGGGRASAARIAMVNLETASIEVMTPDQTKRVGVRPATHQDLEVAGRRDLLPYLKR